MNMLSSFSSVELIACLKLSSPCKPRIFRLQSWTCHPHDRVKNGTRELTVKTGNEKQTLSLYLHMRQDTWSKPLMIILKNLHSNTATDMTVIFGHSTMWYKNLDFWQWLFHVVKAVAACLIWSTLNMCEIGKWKWWNNSWNNVAFYFLVLLIYFQLTNYRKAWFQTFPVIWQNFCVH